MSRAFIFPGQGSQTVSMGKDLYSESTLYKQTIIEASEVLDYDLWAVINEQEATKLNQTEYTQPALLATSIATFRLLMDEKSAHPSVMAGHSLGEYSALVAAGALSFGDALQLVRSRGQFMQKAVASGEGAMAAVLGLDLETLDVVCNSTEGVVEAANINAPGQIVIAGSKASVMNALPMLKEAGAKRAIELPVSVPSHCSLMKPAAEMLQECLKGVDVLMPKIPVVHNVSAAVAESPEHIKQLLVEQLYSPVRWVDCVEAIKALGVHELFEVGPGNVLTGLVKRIDRALPCTAVNSSAVVAGLK